LRSSALPACKPALAAIRAGKTSLSLPKKSWVMAGSLVMSEARKQASAFWR